MAELNNLRIKGQPAAFELSGTVLLVPFGKAIVLRDSSGTTEIEFLQLHAVEPGDIVRIWGNSHFDSGGKRWAIAQKIKKTGHEALPPSVETTVSNLAAGNCNHTVVSVCGTIINIFQDEIDSHFVHAILADQGKTIPVSYHRGTNDINRLLGARVRVVGYSNPESGNLRRFHAGGIAAHLADTVVLDPPPADPFAVPELEHFLYENPENLFSLDRRFVDGTVQAVWGRRNLLISTPDRRLVRANFAEPVPLPSVGSFVRVIGYPETDMFNLNLSSAKWRLEPGMPNAEEIPTPISASAVMPNDGTRKVDPSWHGRLVRITGCIREILRSAESGKILLACDEVLVNVDISALGETLHDIDIDTTVEVTGVCVMDVADWRPTRPFPHIRGFFLIPRSIRDIRVIERPSWWTARRLLAVLGLLFLVTMAVAIWNILLQRITDRKGREIARQQLEIVKSELKVHERTHLAVELHDSLSQTLSGVSMQIDAVQRFAGSDPTRMNQHLGIAAKTLKSCRDELRNCLLDLRSNALEENNMNAAIRKTLEPYLDDADIAIRFFAPREIFSDNSAHTVLRIVRELVVNAIRHGKADRIKVAGSIENRTLMFSVRDNGCGFTHDTAPGIADGHFGLQGICERIDELGGTFEIASAPGNGTKATITLELPQHSAGEIDV